MAKSASSSAGAEPHGRESSYGRLSPTTTRPDENGARGPARKDAMPDVRCPSCEQWSSRDEWADAPDQPFPFLIVCPRCQQAADIAPRSPTASAKTRPLTRPEE